MQLTPRYDGPPVLRIDTPFRNPSVPLLRQRRRLGDLLTDLTAQEWGAASRCEGWSVQDVVSHLVGTNKFWAFSIASGLVGAPTRLLATFDPVATPQQMVETVRDQPPEEVLAQLIETNEALAVALADVDEDAWSTMAEAPPGHIALRGVVLHALWDSWIHERDVLVPLGAHPAEEPDELIGCLTYAAILGPALLAARGSTRTGLLAFDATDPQVQLVVELGPTVVVREGSSAPDVPRFTGTAVDLVEALSFRAPLDQSLGDEHGWMLEGLAEVFDRA